jgi:hypothetical protein
MWIKIGKLLRTNEHSDLTYAFLSQQSEVHVEYVNLMKMPTHFLYFDGRMLTAPALTRIDGQVDIAFPHDGMTAQRSISVTTLSQGDIVSNHEVGKTQRFGEIAAEIAFAGTGDAFVHLLKQQHVGCMVLGNSHNALRPETPIDTNGAVNVVGHDA